MAAYPTLPAITVEPEEPERRMAEGGSGRLAESEPMPPLSANPRKRNCACPLGCLVTAGGLSLGCGHLTLPMAILQEALLRQDVDRRRG